MSPSSIAIVGAACRYPDAGNPAELWENVLAERRAFRRLPRRRLSLDHYGSSDRSAPDVTYGTHAAVLEGYRFDRVRFRVSAATFKSVDLVHWLALDVAADALADAGHPGDFALPRAATAVLVGNTLTGEFSRAAVLRLRWPYVGRVVDSVLEQAGEAAERRAVLLPQIESTFKAPFAPVDGETLAGGLSNTIAGRICNYFNLNGGGYTVDGACASSLLAVAQACSALTAGDVDVALAGGVDLSLDPFELVGFAKAGALASDEMRVYDASPTGFWPGEGCGFVVLMREADARAQHRRIYAIVRGWGVSSDGSGGLTRPEVGGQLLALDRAYARAGFSPETVAYFEGHGTGTAVGDATELAALSAAMRRRGGPEAPAAIGSIKAIIGHTKAAAGVAGLLKAMMACRHQVIPPTSGCRDPHPTLTAPEAVLRVTDRAERWPASMPCRVGVSAMGFGGINVHVALEAAESKPATVRVEERCARSWQDAELLVVSGASAADVREQIDRLSALAPGLSLAEITDLATHLQRTDRAGQVRAALLASTPADLVRQLSSAREAVVAGTRRIDPAAGVFVGAAQSRPRLAFLFSGQAAPVRTHGGLWSRRFADVEALYQLADLPRVAMAADTATAQPAIVTASLAALRRLEAFGVTADVAIGHSLGELTALRWAGALADDATTIALAAIRGRMMADRAEGPGAMAAIAARREVVEALAAGTGATIAGLNAPEQITVSGPRASVDAVLARARDLGFSGTRLPVAYAFHSALMQPVVPAFAEVLGRIAIGDMRGPVISTVTGARVRDCGEVRALLARQLCQPVRFTEALHAAGDVDLFIEAGPGHALAALAAASTSAAAVSVDAAGPSLRPLLAALGAAFAHGVPVATGRLAEPRFSRPFDVGRPREFLTNPCECAPDPRVPAQTGAVEVPASALATPISPEQDSPGEDTCALLRSLVSRAADLPIQCIDPRARFLSDLHLNSLTVAELLTEATRRLGCRPLAAPTEYADASLADAAQALDRIRVTDSPIDAEVQPGLESWVRAFTIVQHEEPLATVASPMPSGHWQVICSPDHPLEAPLKALVERLHNGPGRIVCIDPGQSPSTALLLDAARSAIHERRAGRFVVVQQDAGVGGFARTLFLESGLIDVCVVTVDLADPRAAERVRDEAGAAAGFVEVCYDRTGRRLVPLATVAKLAGTADAVKLGPDDLLLVTGGGKGIAAECALALARDCGVRLALMGRSRPESDATLAANLDRMQAAGATVHYFTGDVSDPEAVRAALDAIRAECGAVTAVLHAAGINEPVLISALDERALQSTMRPKVEGARNILAACDPTRLRLFVTFGSIIARTGLPGEAHYALANERLRELTIRVGHELPGCRALAIEWSVWSATGMGERLGRIDTLARLGVAPIAIDEGVALFKALLSSELPTATVIATGRFGEPATLRLAHRELPFCRFLEAARVHYPGVELIAEATLSLTNDPYLADHRLDGQLVFPAVMGLEAMVQAAVAVRGGTELPVLERIEFTRPIVVPHDAPLVLRALALVEPDGRVRVALRADSTGFAVDHFRATCRWTGPARAEAARPRAATRDTRTVEVDPPRELYGSLLFQSGRFARVCGYTRLFATECVACIGDGPSTWFGPHVPNALLLGDPGARDAVLHSLQASIPQRRVVPIAVEQIVVTGPLQGPCRVDARQREQRGDTYTWDIAVVDADGHEVERWHGLQLRAIASLDVAGLPAALLGPYVERELATLGHATCARVLVTNSRVSGRAAGAAIVEFTSPGARTSTRPDGKPEASDGVGVSAAHAGPLTMAIAGAGALGCDIEPVAERGLDVWRDILGPDRARLADLIARERHEPFTVCATRIWAALESLKKAGAAPASPLVLDQVREDGWVTLRTGSYAVSTWIAEADRHLPVALAVATGVSQHARV